MNESGEFQRFHDLAVLAQVLKTSVVCTSHIFISEAAWFVTSFWFLIMEAIPAGISPTLSENYIKYIRQAYFKQILLFMTIGQKDSYIHVCSNNAEEQFY